jgi:hypothetical protein
VKLYRRNVRTKRIPDASLDEALTALQATPGVMFRSEGGWSVAYDSEQIVSWLLTPLGHAAYPSIVKRHVVNTAAGAEMATDIRCFAKKVACDRYFAKLSEHGACDALSTLSILIGAFMLLPLLKLLYGTAGR